MRTLLLCLLAVFLFASAIGAAEFRFAPPEFEGEYTEPKTATPPARSAANEYFDIALLAAALSLASWFSIKSRSRKYLLLVAAASLLYFGFIRKGCICPVGSVQNVALAIMDSGSVLPLGILLLFLLPLLFALFFGRSFCAGVCPLGAIQEFVLVKPIRIPLWLEQVLAVFAWLYLGLAVLLAGTGSAFVICQYDPFVGFFRLSGSGPMLIAGAAVLLVGMFLGRPYCRFICPYGVILRLMSKLSKWRVTITPDECIKCGLCSDACPYGAIRSPVDSHDNGKLASERKMLIAMILLLPVITGLFATTGYFAAPHLARINPTVRTADEVFLYEEGKAGFKSQTVEAFEYTGLPSGTLYTKADEIKKRFAVAAPLIAGLLGLALSLKLIFLSRREHRDDFEPDRASCFSCGRCFAYCPKDKEARTMTENEA